MPILTHGSDLRLAPAIKPLIAVGDGTVRSAITWARKHDFQAIQLDATLPGIRPRELGKRARKDLTALLHRQDMLLAGLDLFIPRRHYLDSDHIDRAISATQASPTAKSVEWIRWKSWVA